MTTLPLPCRNPPIPLEQKDAPSPVAEAVVSPERVKKGLSAYTGEPEYSGDILADMGTRPAEVPARHPLPETKVRPMWNLSPAQSLQRSLPYALQMTIRYPPCHQATRLRTSRDISVWLLRFLLLRKFPANPVTHPRQPFTRRPDRCTGRKSPGRILAGLRTGEVNPPADYDPEDAAMPGAGTVPADKPRVPHASGMMAGKTPGPGLHPSFEMLPGKERCRSHRLQCWEY